MSAEISPEPTAEEAVAIAAAVEAMWPKPVFQTDDDNPRRQPTWRFSGRWWMKPSAARRERPFR